MFGDFNGGETYYVEFEGVTYKFTASGKELKDAAKVVINTTKVPAVADNALSISIYNAIGLNITHAIDIATFVTVDVNSDYAFLNGPTTIYFTEADRSAKVKATLHTGYDDAGNETTVPSEEVVITSYDGSNIVDAKYSLVWDGGYINQWTGNLKHDFAIQDETGLLLQIILKDAAGNWLSLDQAGITKVEAANANFLVVQDPVSNDRETTREAQLGLKIQGINPGSTAFLLYKMKADGTEYVVQTLPVTVKAQRVVDKVTVTLDQPYLNVDFQDRAVVGGAATGALAASVRSDYQDEITFTMTVKDQYGDNYGRVTPTVEQQGNNAAAQGPIALGNGFAGAGTGVYKYTINASDLNATKIWANQVYAATEIANGKTAPFQLIFKASDNLQGWVVKTGAAGFTAGHKGLTAKTFQVRSSGTSLDTSIERWNWPGTADMRVWGFNDGYIVSKQALYQIDDVPTIADTVAAINNKITGTTYTGTELDLSGTNTTPIGQFVYTIKYNGAIKTAANVASSAAWTSNITNASALKRLSLKNFNENVAATASAIKIEKGSYIINFYQLTKDGTKTAVKNLGSRTVTVTDNQKAGSFTKLKDSIVVTAGGVSAYELLKAVKLTFDGRDYNWYNAGDVADVTWVNCVVSTTDNNVYVKGVQVQYKNERIGKSFTSYIAVEKLFNIE